MPSLATREFLHLLSKDKLASNVPFIYISDHDSHAMEIVNVLKVDTRATSFAYSSTVYPRLKWAGVSIRCYTKLAVAWPEWELARRLRLGECTEEGKEEELKRIIMQRDRRLFQPLQSDNAKLNKTDRALITHMYNYGVVSRVHDPLLYEDLVSMGMNGEPGTNVAISENPGGNVSNPPVYCLEISY